MRQLGMIRHDQEAAHFAAYLLTQGISTHVEKEEDGWSVWVRDEDQVGKAKQEMSEFEADPQADRYKGVERTAASLQHEEIARRRKARKNFVQVRSQWSKGSMDEMPLLIVLIILSVLVTLLTNLGRDPKWAPEMFFADPTDVTAGNDYLYNIRQGEVWRLVTPIFVHMSGFHILFNMIWLYVLGSQCERLRGTVRFGLIVLLTALISNFAEAAAPLEMGGGNVRFGGMSGVVYGLFGYVWIKSRIAPSSGFMISDFAVIFILAWMILCMSGAIQGIANVAHVAGLLCGMAIAYLPAAMQPQGKA